MKNFPVVKESESLEKLLTQVREIHEFLAEFYKEIPVEFFDAKAIPDGWTPKRNLEHIIISNKYFGLWIGAPGFLLKLWGKPKKNQIPIERIDATNRKAIKEYGVYRPTESPFPEEMRDKLLDQLKSSVIYLEEKISKRTEEELDTFKALFGGMSLRTFVYFILKHNLHHSQVVQLRLQKK